MTMPKPIRSMKTVTKMMISGVVKNFSLSVWDVICLKLDSAVNVRKRDRQFDRLQLDNVALFVEIICDPTVIRLTAVHLHIHHVLVDDHILLKVGAVAGKTGASRFGRYARLRANLLQ